MIWRRGNDFRSVASLTRECCYDYQVPRPLCISAQRGLKDFGRFSMWQAGKCNLFLYKRPLFQFLESISDIFYRMPVFLFIYFCCNVRDNTIIRHSSISQVQKCLFMLLSFRKSCIASNTNWGTLDPLDLISSVLLIDELFPLAILTKRLRVWLRSDSGM